MNNVVRYLYLFIPWATPTERKLTNVSNVQINNVCNLFRWFDRLSLLVEHAGKSMLVRKWDVFENSVSMIHMMAQGTAATAHVEYYSFFEFVCILLRLLLKVCINAIICYYYIHCYV